MNAGIVIAVAEYQDTANNLLACANDGRVMYELLRGTKKYEENILYISAETQSTTVKERVVQFIDRLTGQQVDEVFFLLYRPWRIYMK